VQQYVHIKTNQLLHDTAGCTCQKARYLNVQAQPGN
jgi:hypothetical protein